MSYIADRYGSTYDIRHSTYAFYFSAFFAFSRKHPFSGAVYTSGMQKALLIIAKTGFQDHELQGTRTALLDRGFDVLLASTEVGACNGKYGSVEQASVALKDVDVANYDRIAFIGGPGAGALAKDVEALRIARETVQTKKPLGAICIAPLILAKAGVLQRKRATVWDDGEGTQKRILASAGAEVVDQSVVVDGFIVTANGPQSAMDFGEVFADRRY